MIILDTNVVSETSKQFPNAEAVAWLNRQAEDTLFLTAINVAELQEGIVVLPDGKRKEFLRKTISSAIDAFVNPILPFDRQAGYKHAELVMRAKAKRYTLPFADGYIAAIAAVHGYTVATRDVEPFLVAGVPVINPWEER